jgi:hypothetical protein
MLKHPDSEVQCLVEMLESQRDKAMIEAAGFSRMAQELQARVTELEAQVAKGLDNQCGEKVGGTD